MALTFNFSALPVIKVFGFPVLATLAAGAGTLAAYVAEPAMAANQQQTEIIATLPAMAPAAIDGAPARATSVKRTCGDQSWPYIESRCIANAPNRNVRFVMAPTDGDTISSVPSAGLLVSSDGVLRGRGVAPEASDQPVVKKEQKRSETRRHHEARHMTASNEQRIVVRPLRLDYSSRF